MTDLLEIGRDVRRALAAGRPVVALESTVIAHGLPQPDNLDTALAMEAAVREGGAVPATIGLIDGTAVIGMSTDQIRRMASVDDVFKVSRRDLAAVLATGANGATTVAATIFLAARAGIAMMATGGLGGVHRGGEVSLDVSADLYQLSRVPVGVVCAGAKAILDLPRTLEVLETLGVPVVGFRTSEFPAFYSSESGLETSHTAATVEEVARLLDIQTSLGLGGALIVQPPPAERAIPKLEVEGWIATALEEAAETGVTGGAVTPFLLERVSALSEGRTLSANIALLIQNAKLAAGVARALAPPA